MSSRPLDQVDLAILRQLQDDGRRSFTDIASALGLSVGTIRNRFTRLLEDGTLHVIGRADPHRVGFHAPANVHIAVRPPQLITAAAAQIADLPETSYVAIVSGPYDLEVDVMCRDLAHLTELVTERLPRIPGVADTHTSLILRVVKYAQPNLELLHPEAQGAAEGDADTTDPNPSP
ncbi:Lrp/AsnC family transcriptional regulator [Truepera radiovictrix]|uniref:Transcriptional regulator, AsnC family n=1 Tax=Truepera radiovictrix (strain DSM 17093 / CIP 108686 / LMG 22925 / RQ-24) TaxID=649638 RepID=D7CX26_TRURR|nr:Lrp/AsnC family transcriptional regulator [Truepera radiovictrix]ADI14534.1 transcriptional regulator, AsnC family [Truepera radiovictrix DSM 17093]WMT56915.1 Lrp/AsnC family transcriptional regulator [Truepera radiovictrix]